MRAPDICPHPKRSCQYLARCTVALTPLHHVVFIKYIETVGSPCLLLALKIWSANFSSMNAAFGCGYLLVLDDGLAGTMALRKQVAPSHVAGVSADCWERLLNYNQYACRRGSPENPLLLQER